MKALLQRVTHASASIDGNCVGSIQQGIVLLLGVGYEDGPEQIEKLCQRVCKLRIFDDEGGVMNRSLLDIGGEALVVSQFTLMANCRKGYRPSYIEAAKGEVSEPLYEQFVAKMRLIMGADSIKTGKVGADMQVEIHNDGPVTIILDTDTPQWKLRTKQEKRPSTSYNGWSMSGYAPTAFATSIR